MSNIQLSISDLFKCGAHFGHRTRFRNPKMEEYIYGIRDGLSIIDLDQTRVLFNNALDAVEKIIANNGVVVFVGTKKTAQDIIREAAKSCNMPYVDKRWLGGMLTNFSTIRALVKRYVDLSTDLEGGRFLNLTKKEQLCMHRQVLKLESSLGGVKNMKSLPDALFVVDVKEEAIAVREANKLGIPVIALVDTNSDPFGVNYVIPANDDAMSSISYFSNTLATLISDVLAKQVTERESQVPKPIISRIKKRHADEDSVETTDIVEHEIEIVQEEVQEPVKKVKVVHTRTVDTAIETVKEEVQEPVKKVKVVHTRTVDAGVEK